MMNPQRYELCERVALPRRDTPFSLPRILIIENDPAIQELLRWVLGLAGYGMTVCAGRQTALTWIDETVQSSERFAVILIELGEGEMEIGIGIHGEPGRRRMKLTSAAEITEMLAEPVIADLELKAGEHVLAFVNGMGVSHSLNCTSLLMSLLRYYAVKTLPSHAHSSAATSHRLRWLAVPSHRSDSTMR